MKKLITICVVHILLPESKKYQVRFTAEEVEILERVRKKYNLNVNQFIKQSVFWAVEMQSWQMMVEADPEIKQIFMTTMDESRKIMSNPRILKRLEKRLRFEKITQEGLDKLERSASDLEKDVETLRKKKKPGPKKTKKPRGRPKKR